MTAPRPAALAMLAMLAVLYVLACASPAIAQTTSARVSKLFYGVSGGPGRGTVTGGIFALPEGAPPPDTNRRTVTLGLFGGVKLADAVGVLVVWDQTFGGKSSYGQWGSTAASVAGRLWLTHRVYVEAGGGLAELGYKPPTQTSGRISRFWSPGFETAAGVDLLKGPRVALTTLARYSAATFDGLRVRNFSVQIGLSGSP
ncbi:MAG: hypothetical protein ABI634_00150 [Acidobacteriota bacterium]